MTKLRKRFGAWCLVIALAASLFAESASALAAEAGDSTAQKPELVMDFLGDNKSEDSYGKDPGTPGDGTLHDPADKDQALPDNKTFDGKKWNGYVDGDQGTGTETIFWVGIGIKHMDQFVLAEDQGLHSVELALYYDPQYAEPYQANDAAAFQSAMEKANLGTAQTKNQWGGDYSIVAMAGQDPAALADPADSDSGYGTEEFEAPKDWKMAYVSIERTGDANAPRFKDGNDDSTYYIAMVPFVLKGYDQKNELCIRLARNASAFSIGSAEGGCKSYGNWDKYTYHDPGHDLKLMLDYTGDLNIFTNGRQRDEHRATLSLQDGGNANNKAKLTIHKDARPDAQVADKNGASIERLSGGEVMLLEIQKVSGFTAQVRVRTADDRTVTYSPLADPEAGEAYTFIMPSRTDVTVTVIFSGSVNPETEYKATLSIGSNEDNKTENNAKLTTPGSAATGTVSSPGDPAVTLMVTANNSVDIVIARNSDFDVTVEATAGVEVKAVNITDTALTYRFVMPASDVEVKVNFVKATKYTATVSVDQADSKEKNSAQLQFTNGDGEVQQSPLVSGQDTPADSKITTRAGRVVTILTNCDPAYEVKSVTVTRNNGGTATVPVTRSPYEPSNYTFTMPAYDVDVVVTFQKVQLYKVKLIVGGTEGDETATLNGADARGTETLTRPDSATPPSNEGVMEVFANAKMQVLANGLEEKRTAVVEISYTSSGEPGDVINPAGSAATGFTFDMVPLDDPKTDMVTVKVTFQDANKTPLTAKIEQKHNNASQQNSYALWTGAEHNKDITVYEGDRLSVDITVEPGAYLSRVQVLDDDEQPLPVPVTLSGIGYNGGRGGEETASFTMPNQNATLLVEYTKGTPPAEPTFYASITQTGKGTVSIRNGTATADPAVTQVPAFAGDIITAAYQPKDGYFVADVTVTPDVPGTAVDWNFKPGGGVELTMPAANVVVDVTFAAVEGATKSELTIAKDPTTLDGNKVATTTSAGTEIVVDGEAKTTFAYDGELVVLDIQVAPGHYVTDVTVNGESVSANLSGNGYNGRAGGSVTASFTMPNGDATAVVSFKNDKTDGDPANTVTLAVDPAGGSNSAKLFIGGVSVGKAPGDVTRPAAPGQRVEVVAEPAAGYSVAMPVVITPSGVVIPTWTDTDRFRFVMPNEPVTVHVTFRKGEAAQFRADLILRGDAGGVAAAKATFGGYDELNGRESSHIYSKPAAAGADIPFAVNVPVGYYISSVTVTPADFGVTPAMTGSIGIQSGRFTMPAGNVYVNITIEKGWPDEAKYPVTLHTNAADITDAKASIVNGTEIADEDNETISAVGDDSITVSVTPGNGMVTAAYAITAEGALIDITPSLVGAMQATSGTFVMPYGTSVDVYVRFDDSMVSPPGADDHLLELMATGDAGGGTATASVGENTITATAVGGDAMWTAANSKVTVTAAPAEGYVLHRLTAKDEDGGDILLTIDDDAGGEYTFTMPAGDVRVEAEFRKAAPKSYQVQVVVNNTVNGGMGTGNTAFLYYTPPEDTSKPFTFMSGVAEGTSFDLALTVESGYQVTSILTVPQGSGVDMGITPPLTSSQRTKFTMPASDLVIYVVFGLDTTTRHSVTGTISYIEGVEKPTGDMNTLTLVGTDPTNKSEVYSSNSMDTTPAIIQEAQDGMVTVKWAAADGYRVQSYTVTTVTGKTVLSQPVPGGDGNSIQFVMPGAPVLVDVKFTTDEAVLPPAGCISATLHYVGGVTGDKASITNRNLQNVTTDEDNGQISAMPGDEVNISATPASGRHVQSIYVLRDGQMLALSDLDLSADPESESNGRFYMPSGDVDVYVVFSDKGPAEGSHQAVLTVNGPNGSGSAVMFVTGADPANSTDKVDAGESKGITITEGGLVQVTVKVAPGYAIESVAATPIDLRLELRVDPATPTVYTFTMPNADVGIIVTLKAERVVTHRLNLHTDNVGGNADQSANTTTLSYGSEDAAQSVEAIGATDKTLQTPAGTVVTLTVAPNAGYFVRAAYAVYNSALVKLSSALEGKTSDDDEADKKATFTMPAGVTDVYVVYEHGTVPDPLWYNVVVIATDIGGPIANTGYNTVKVSSFIESTNPDDSGTSRVPGVIDPANEASNVASNGAAKTFYSVSKGEIIHLDATGADDGYQYDTMSLSGTNVPKLTPVDTENNHRGEVQEFTMPASNVAAHVNFKTTGVTGLKATLHIVNPDKLAGNTVTMSVGDEDQEGYQEVHKNGESLTDLTSSEIVVTLVDPLDNSTRIVKVIVTKEGMGSEQALSSSDQLYTYVMEDRNVDIWVVLAKKTDTDRFVAMARAVYDIPELNTAGNGFTKPGDDGVSTAVTNVTDPAMPNGEVWTEVRGGDQAAVTYTTEPGVYAYVTAQRVDDNTTLPVVQFGVGSENKAATGTAYVDVPTPGCDVQIYVTFSTTPPTAQKLTFASTGHDKKPENTASLFVAEETEARSTLTPGETSSDLLVETLAGEIAPDTALKVTAGVADGYLVKHVEITVTTGTRTATVIRKMDDDGTLDSLLMPNGETTITVVYVSGAGGPVPSDPGNTGSTDSTGNKVYEDHWIRAENRGDYAIVTVPVLEDAAGNLYDVDETEHSFKIYLKDGEENYIDLLEQNIITLSHPDPENGADPYETGVYYKNGTTGYTGARFVLTVIEDAEDWTNDQASWAKRLRDILNNNGTANADKGDERLYITCVEAGADGVDGTESRLVDLEIPRYYTLAGVLESWAPTHVATLSLYRGDETEPCLVIERTQAEGWGLCRQSFAFKSSELMSDTPYRMTIEKPAHIPYTRTEIYLNGEAAGDLYEASSLEFHFADSIYLIGGDLDGNGNVLDSDRSRLLPVLYGDNKWTSVPPDAKETDPDGWRKSTLNPDSWPYVLDLNGDGKITDSDLMVIMNPLNYNHWAKHYGTPTGLNGGTEALAALLSEDELAQVEEDELLPPESEAPEEPIDPGFSVDPEEPVDPGFSVDPEEPIDPGFSMNPEEPVDPGFSVDPEEPIDPGFSVDPEEPIDPELSAGPETLETDPADASELPDGAEDETE